MFGIYSHIRRHHNMGRRLFISLQVLASVHAQAAGTTAEAVAFRAKLAAIALFAVHAALVFGNGRRLEHLLAQTASEAHFVPLLASA